MFKNYTDGMIIDNKHSATMNYPEIYHKDSFGNVVGISFTPISKFTIKLTTDTIIPIVKGSLVLTGAETPKDTEGTIGRIAYNINRFRCWKFNGNTWEEQQDIISDPSSNALVRFSDPNSHIKVEILNFRNEVLKSILEPHNAIEVEVDNDLHSIMPEGNYYINVIKKIGSEEMLVRRIDVSVGYEDSYKKPLFGGYFNGTKKDEPIPTDSTLKYDGCVLSVVTLDELIPNCNLPVSSNAVVNAIDGISGDVSDVKAKVEELGFDLNDTNEDLALVNNEVQDIKTSMSNLASKTEDNSFEGRQIFYGETSYAEDAHFGDNVYIANNLYVTDTMSLGDLAKGPGRILNVQNPIESTEVANKAYVDAEIDDIRGGLTQETDRAMSEEARIEALFSAPTQEAVDTWLNAHPEATTTVTDGALNLRKFKSGEVDFVTLEHFGAVGDGITNDTNALESALTSGKIISLAKNAKYKLTRPINITNSVCIIGNGAEFRFEVSGNNTLIKANTSTYYDIESTHVSDGASSVNIPISVEKGDVVFLGSDDVRRQIDETHSYRYGHICEVTDITGSNIKFYPPVRYGFNVNKARVYKINNVYIENLKIKNAGAAGKIFFSCGGKNFVLKNVTLEANLNGIDRIGVEAEYAMNVAINGCKAIGFADLNSIDTRSGYGFSLGGHNQSVVNCEVIDCKEGISTNSRNLISTGIRIIGNRSVITANNKNCQMNLGMHWNSEDVLIANNDLMIEYSENNYPGLMSIRGKNVTVSGNKSRISAENVVYGKIYIEFCDNVTIISNDFDSTYLFMSESDKCVITGNKIYGINGNDGNNTNFEITDNIAEAVKLAGSKIVICHNSIICKSSTFLNRVQATGEKFAIINNVIGNEKSSNVANSIKISVTNSVIIGNISYGDVRAVISDSNPSETNKIESNTFINDFYFGD